MSSQTQLQRTLLLQVLLKVCLHTTGTGEGLYYYNGSAWVSTSLAGDISSVTVNTNSNSGLAGGQTANTGAFTSNLTLDANNLSAVTVDVANDSVLFTTTAVQLLVKKLLQILFQLLLK